MEKKITGRELVGQGTELGGQATQMFKSPKMLMGGGAVGQMNKMFTG